MPAKHCSEIRTPGTQFDTVQQNSLPQPPRESMGQNALNNFPDMVEKAHKAAVDFEGVTIGELLKPMFDTIDTSKNIFGGGKAEEQFRSLQISELGKDIAENGGIGLAESVYRKMLEMQEMQSRHTGTGPEGTGQTDDKKEV